MTLLLRVPCGSQGAGTPELWPYFAKLLITLWNFVRPTKLIYSALNGMGPLVDGNEKMMHFYVIGNFPQETGEASTEGKSP